jgi:pimeloyl-ACP methyl ester carboxylesterase
VQPYLISWFAYDPRVEISKTTGRITIVQGTHDVQVSVDDGKALAAARPGATFVLIDGMTHVLVDDPGTTIAEQVTGAYADASRPLDTRLVATLGGAVSS